MKMSESDKAKIRVALYSTATDAGEDQVFAAIEAWGLKQVSAAKATLVSPLESKCQECGAESGNLCRDVPGSLGFTHTLRGKSALENPTVTIIRHLADEWEPHPDGEIQMFAAALVQKLDESCPGC